MAVKREKISTARKRMEACTICNGNPKRKSSKLQDFKFDYCDECFLIINYEKIKND